MRSGPSWQILSHLFLWGLETALAIRLGCWPGCLATWPIQSCYWGRFQLLISGKNFSPFCSKWGQLSSKEVLQMWVKGRGTPEVPLHWLALVGHVLCGQGWWQKLLHCCVPLWARFCKGDLPPWLGGTGQMCMPFYRVPTAWHCWGDLFLVASWPGPPVATRASMTAQMTMTAWLPVGDRMVQSFDIFLQ